MNRNPTVNRALGSLSVIGFQPKRRNFRLRCTYLACAVFCLLSLAAVPGAWAQRATLSGVVRDRSEAVNAGAKIRVANLNTQGTLTAESNATGYYVVGNLTPKTYTIDAQKEGFKTATRPDVSLEVAQSAALDFQLELWPNGAIDFCLKAPPLPLEEGGP